jgi:hypothetical protein
MITMAQGLCWSTNSPNNNTLANQIPTTNQGKQAGNIILFI